MRYFVVLIIIFTSVSCYQVDRDCNKFRTGTFVWEQEVGGKLLKTTFTRSEHLQIEHYDNVIDSSRVEWINDCEWRVIPINPKTNADSRAYLFKILSTKENSYKFEFKQSGRDQTYTGTAVKIK